MSMGAAFLFPIPILFLAIRQAQPFYMLFRMVFIFGEILFLPCVLGILSSMIFLPETENNVLKFTHDSGEQSEDLSLKVYYPYDLIHHLLLAGAQYKHCRFVFCRRRDAAHIVSMLQYIERYFHVCCFFTDYNICCGIWRKFYDIEYCFFYL